MLEDVRKKFAELFPGTPMMVSSPGRINLIGEHTDYNNGFVMPAAINFAAYFAIAPSGDGRSVLHALNYNESLEVDLDHPDRVEHPKWANYLLGVLRQVKDHRYRLQPFNCVLGGDIPVGAGLSSSAAIECGFVYALNALHNYDIPRLEMVKMAQWAEHHYAGVLCGIMDQFASMMGKRENVIVLDCRSLAYHYSPLNLTDHALVLCDSRVKHSLVDSEYNTRRQECEKAVEVLRNYHPEVHSLRDVTEPMLREHRHELPGKVYDRALYVVQEIARVLQASDDLKAGRLEAFGKKMFETHHGLSKLYEVSCAELDFLVEEAQKNKAVLGARMMGGGFGGCTINLIRNDVRQGFLEKLSRSYREKFGIDPGIYPVTIADGTKIISDSKHE